MDREEFKESANKVSNMIVNYMEEVPNLAMSTNVQPGSLENDIENECPKDGSPFVQILGDFEKIKSNLVHRTSPHFHSDQPTGNSYASMVAEMLTAGFNMVSLNWEASPAATELEVVVLNWIGKMIDLPDSFHRAQGTAGGGVLQNTSNECILISLLSARKRAIESYRTNNSEETIGDAEIIAKFVIYSSSLAKSSAEIVSNLTAVTVRHLTPNDEGKISSDILKIAFSDDIKNGLIPLLYVSTMGTHSVMSYDNLEDIGPVCLEHNVWLHVDADTAGMALICPEFREMGKGLKHADSFALGLYRLLISQDVVAYWIKDASLLNAALSMDPLYLRHKHVGTVHEYVNWQIGTGRKFKALKIWMTMKSYGLEKMQDEVRKQVAMAQNMEELVTKDNRFELVVCRLWMCVFRLRAEPGNDKNHETKTLLERITKNGKISLGEVEVDNKFCLQFFANQNMTEEDVIFAWQAIDTALWQ